MGVGGLVWLVAGFHGCWWAFVAVGGLSLSLGAFVAIGGLSWSLSAERVTVLGRYIDNLSFRH